MGRTILVYTILIVATTPVSTDDESYFREGVFDQEDKKIDNSKALRYTRYLRAMDEPSLWRLSKDDRMVVVYRLLWLPSFHPPISVRIVKSGKSGVLHLAKLNGTGGGVPGKVAIAKTRRLTEDEWAMLQVYLDRSRYWKMSTSLKMDLATGLVADGDNLICEAVENGRYHIVSRSDSDADYEALCRFILGLSGLDVREAWAEYHGENEAPH